MFDWKTSRSLAVILAHLHVLGCGPEADPGAGAGGKGGNAGSSMTGGAGSQPDGAVGPDGQADGSGGHDGGNPANCPATYVGGGPCTDVMLECHYVGDKGCPLTIQCFPSTGQPNWEPRIPESGGPCTTGGQVCTYAEANLTGPLTFGALRCGDSGTWEKASACPPSIPTNGEPCMFPTLACSYQGGCGGTRPLAAYCNGAVDGWQVERCPDAGADGG